MGVAIVTGAGGLVGSAIELCEGFAEGSLDGDVERWVAERDGDPVAP
jgi:hypothetical protein